MAKITLNTILSSFASTSLFNTNFTAIEDELNDKVLYRNNPMGEANEMLNDLDMNSNDILNAGDIATATITVGGIDLTAQVAAAATSAANAATSEANAATSETNAAASEAAAAVSETNAAASAAAAQASADSITGTTYTRTEFTSSAGVDTFAVTYNPGFIVVTLNGVELADADYTATNGTQVILATPLASNSDILAVRAFNNLAFANCLQIANDLSDVNDAPTAFDNIKQAATTTTTGVVEAADASEMTAGTAGKYPDCAIINGHYGEVQETTALLVGTFASCGSIKISRRGNVVTISATGNFGSTATLSNYSSTALIPTWARPVTGSVENVYKSEPLGIFECGVTTGGDFFCNQLDWAGASVAASTSLLSSLNISYTV